MRGTAFSVGGNRWSVDTRPRGFVAKRRNGTLGWERSSGSPKRRKALKGEAQERWELKEASEGVGTRGARREGSQTLSMSLPWETAEPVDATLETVR